MKKYILLSFGLVLVPLVSFAADAFSVLTVVQAILNIVIPLLITIAVIYFIWGVIQYTISSDEEAKKNARSKIIMGLIGLFVIITFWGLVRVISNTFKIRPESGPGILPCVPNPRAGIFC